MVQAAKRKRATFALMVKTTGIAKNQRVGQVWLALCIALVLHVIDEASTGFLRVYNPTVLALRERIPRLPMPVFEFNAWLSGLIIANIVLLLLSRFVFKDVAWMKPVA
jgi:hypothetical protein